MKPNKPFSIRQGIRTEPNPEIDEVPEALRYFLLKQFQDEPYPSRCAKLLEDFRRQPGLAIRFSNPHDPYAWTKFYKFIEEFALTFDGNKWGHNGPYLVSRVVSRVSRTPGFNFTVLPPSAFYPVNWSRIRNFFRGPTDKVHSSWLHKKLEQIKSESFAVHLWNKQSREIKVESGSIINYIMLDCCVFCNSSSSSL